MEIYKNITGLDIDALYEIVCRIEPGNLLINYDSELSLNDFKALRTIHSYTPHCPVHIIGKSLNITKSGATRFINRLEKFGLIKKCISSKDGRVCCIVLTKKGDEIHNRAVEYCKNEIEKMLPTLKDENMLDMNRCLNKFVVAVNNNMNG